MSQDPTSRQPVPRLPQPLIRGAANDLWRVLPDVLLYELLFAVLGGVILSPLVAWLFNRLAAASGNAAVGNLDIVWFLLTPTGGLLGLLILATAFALVQANVAGVLSILYGAARGRRVTYYDALRLVARRFGRILASSLIVLCLLLLAAAPFVAIAVGVAFAKLGEFDINFYLDARPPELLSALRWGAVILTCAVGAAIAVAVPLVFVLPEVLFGERGAWAAVQASYRLARGRRARIAALIVGWFVIWQIATIVAAAASYWLAGLAITANGLSVGAQLALLGTITAAALVTNFLIGQLAAAIGGGLLARMYDQAIGEEAPLPWPLANARMLSDTPRWSLGRRGPIYATLALAAIAALLVRQVLVNTSFEDRVGIVAHRGSSLAAPENTLAAVRLAIEEGATAIEIDVQRTTDGEIVVMHDADLMRVSGSPLVVQRSTLKELRAVKVHGEPIPTLDEIIDVTKGRVGLLVELKSLGGASAPLVEGVVEVLRRREMLDHAAVMSFVYEEARAVERLEPRLEVGFLASARIGDLTRLEVDFLAVSRGQATDALVALAHARDRRIYVWTINERRDMQTLLDRGVDSIITKKPAVLVELLRERAALEPSERLLLRLKTLYLR